MPFQIPPAVFTHPGRLEPSAWIEHTPFAKYLIAKLEPRKIVELGVHNGVSLCAFAQAVKDLDLKTELHGIDSFEGDAHAGFYDTSIYDSVKSYTETNYPNYVHILKGYFENYLGDFADKGVDILHIDGMHDYDSVKRDYDTWSPKVKDGGIILFHDTKVFERDFGVWKFWAEVTERRKSFEFEHGYGLGVLAVGDGPGSDLIISLLENKNFFLNMFSALGDRSRLHYELSQAGIKNEVLSKDIQKITNDLHTVSSQQANISELEKDRVMLKSILDSKSWKFTAPLREIMHKFNK